MKQWGPALELMFFLRAVDVSLPVAVTVIGVGVWLAVCVYFYRLFGKGNA